jgi:peptidyl-prolyl cis-trans isomerase-like 6
MATGQQKVLLSVVGNLDDPGFHQCRLLAEAIADEFSPVSLDVRALVHTDYEDFVLAKSKELGAAGNAEAYNHTSSPFVFYNGCNYIGGVRELAVWARRVYDITINKDASEYEAIAKDTKANFMQESKSSFCYIDVGLEEEEAPQRVTIELYDDVCPKTCDNFRNLCSGKTGRSYAGSPFHRVMKDGYVQGGDIDGGRGDGGESSAGDPVPDEGFSVSHGKSGIVSMANTGAHSNKSQFFVTLKDMSWLDQKFVAFGRVVFGMNVFKRINALPVENQRPLQLPRIVGGGVEEAPEVRNDMK